MLVLVAVVVVMVVAVVTVRLVVALFVVAVVFVRGSSDKSNVDCAPHPSRAIEP